jgi:hypothetical protein
MTASKHSQDGTVFHPDQKTPDDEQRGCPKHVEFCNRINLINRCIWLVIKKKFITMHGNMNVTLTE